MNLLKEAIRFALQALWSNPLRTFLSLLGISIGIFCIIGVFTLVDALKYNIRSNINALGQTTFYVSKYAWAFEPNYPWWKYASRPTNKPIEAELIKKQAPSIQYAGIQYTSYESLKSTTTDTKATVVGVSTDIGRIEHLEVQLGRYFTDDELQTGRSVCVVGATVFNNLFPNQPFQEGLELTIKGKKYTLIGLFEKNDEGMFVFNNYNEQVYISELNFRNSFGAQSGEPNLIVLPKPNTDPVEVQFELEGVLRKIRNLQPLEDNNFSINKSDMIQKAFDPLFGILSLAGALIGGFSILVGGFGIANIMYVSVKERTPIIGIQKALGAKNRFILTQFLVEAVVLSSIGGCLGLLGIGALTLIAQYGFDLDIFLSLNNIIFGLLLSSTIGLLAGFLPARMASRLTPVEAIRS